MSTLEMTRAPAGAVRIVRRGPGGPVSSTAAPRGGGPDDPVSWSVVDWLGWLQDPSAGEGTELPFHIGAGPGEGVGSYAWANGLLSLTRLMEAVRISGADVGLRVPDGRREAWTEHHPLDGDEASTFLLSWIVELFERYGVAVDWLED